MIVTKHCDECGEVVEQLFTDIRRARVTDLDRLDQELAAIGSQRLSLEEMNLEGADDLEMTQFMQWLLADDDTEAQAGVGVAA